MPDWNSLPKHVLLQTFSFLNFEDRMAIMLVCKYWYFCSSSPVLWKQFSFDLTRPERLEAHTKMLQKHIDHITAVNIHIVTELDANMENACSVMVELAKSRCQLESFSLRCSGANIVWSPLFSKILLSLNSLLSSESTSKLKHFSCSELKFPIGDSMLSKLARDHNDLETVDIQTPSTSVTPQSVKILVQSCPKLRKLCASFTSMSDEVFESLIKANYRALRLLSLTFGGGRGIRRRLSSELWKRVVNHIPALRVNLHFNFLSTRSDISSILQAGIPLAELTLNVLFEAHEEIAHIEAEYSETLKKFTVTAPSSAQLENALLSLVQNATHLENLTCFCNLNPSFRNKVLQEKPGLECFVCVTEEFDQNFMQVMTGRTANLEKLKDLGYM